MNAEQQEALRKPFPPETIGKLPRVTCKDCSDKNKQCSKHQKAKCAVCSAFISTQHIHLDYVGHAAVTDRLLAVDPFWNWEPYAFDSNGQPVIDRSGSEAYLWVKLTILGVTRPAVGTAPTQSFELPKQLISDAIRNGAMRFGVALDLWSKEDLGHDDTDAAESAPPAQTSAAVPSLNLVEEAWALVGALPNARKVEWSAWMRTMGWDMSKSAWDEQVAQAVIDWTVVA